MPVLVLATPGCHFQGRKGEKGEVVLLRAQADDSGLFLPLWARFLQRGTRCWGAPPTQANRGEHLPCFTGMQNLYLLPYTLPIPFQK